MESNSNDHLMEVLRYNYDVIYSWHKNHGRDQYLQRFENIDKNRLLEDRYISFLERLIHPNEANPEFMGKVAWQVLSGCMEWSYSKVYNNEIPLNVAAKKINKVLDEMKNKENDSGNIEDLKKIKNISSSKEVEPIFIEVEMGDSEYSEKYHTYAKIAYADVLRMNESIGGFVALAETNLERERNRSRTDRTNEHKIRFRNSKFLNLIEIKDSDSIVEKVKNNYLTILSIKLGG